MSIDVDTDGAEEWISGLKARRCLRMSYGSLARLAILGKVRTRFSTLKVTSNELLTT